MPKKLPVELTSLIHHIQLNESNWWEKSLGQMILYVIWLNTSLTIHDIQTQLETQFSINLLISKIEEFIHSLEFSNTIVLLTNNAYKISEIKLSEINKQIDEAEATDNQVKIFFGDLLANKCSSLPIEETWTKFNQNLLLPLVEELGAKTYELISGINQNLDNSESLENFLFEFPKENQTSLREVILSFLNPQNPAVRSYVLRHLNAFFFIEASSLREDTINSLLRITQGNHVLRLFLDSNIVFSMLGFHNNPSNEAVKSLIELEQI